MQATACPELAEGARAAGRSGKQASPSGAEDSSHAHTLSRAITQIKSSAAQPLRAKCRGFFEEAGRAGCHKHRQSLFQFPTLLFSYQFRQADESLGSRCFVMSPSAWKAQAWVCASSEGSSV